MHPTTDLSTAYEPDDAVAYHARLAADWEARYQKRSFRARVEVLEECLRGRELAGAEWLDAGCGTGTLTRFLAVKGCSVIGVDAAPGMIEVARERAQGHANGERMRFCVAGVAGVGTIEQLSSAAGSLDGVLCSSVLEYVPDAERCLAEFARVLKTGGVLLVSVPNAQSVVRRGQVSIHRWGRRWGRRWLDFIEYSRNEYSMGQFTAMLVAQGFEVERTIAFGSPMPRWMQRARLGGSLLMFLAVRR